MTFWGGGHAFKIEALGFLWRSLSRFGEIELRVAFVGQQISQQTFARFAERDQRGLAVCKHQVGGKKAAAIRARLSVLVSSMRAEPVDALTYLCTAFNIRFEILSLNLQKRIAIELAHRVSALIPAIDPQGVLFVIGDNEQIRTDSHTSRGISHPPIPRFSHERHFLRCGNSRKT